MTKLLQAVEQIHIPHRTNNLAADAWVPLTQAAIDATLSGALIGAGLLTADYLVQPTRWLPWLAHVLPVGLTFLSVLAYRWPGHLAQARSTTWEYRRLPIDTNGDGQIQPSELKRPVYVDSRQLPKPDPATAAYTMRLRQFVADCQTYDGTGRTLKAQGWTEQEISLFASHLIAHKGGRWRNRNHHQLSWELGTPDAVANVIARTIWV